MEYIDCVFRKKREIIEKKVGYKAKIICDEKKIKQVYQINNLELTKIDKLEDENYNALKYLLNELNPGDFYDYRDDEIFKIFAHNCKTCKYFFSKYFYNRGYFFSSPNEYHLCCIECKLLNDKDNYQKNIANMLVEIIKLPYEIMFPILTFLPSSFYNQTNTHLKHCCLCKKKSSHLVITNYK